MLEEKFITIVLECIKHDIDKNNLVDLLRKLYAEEELRKMLVKIKEDSNPW